MAKKVTPEVESFARIRVIGVGGSGGNAVNHMIESKVKGVEFIAVNTDAQDLHHSLSKHRIHIGKNLTKGLGTGMDSDIGKRAAEETKEELQETINGSDMVFIAGGMGGGTGTGASAVVAKTAKEQGALTVAVVTKPFFFEGAQRMRLADQGLEALRKEVDALIIIPNDKLLQTVDKETTASEAFAMSDEILRVAVEGISDLIIKPGVINVDFADIRSIMENAGSALMGIGVASGDNRAVEAAKIAINSPLLDISVDGAKGVLFAIAGGSDMTMNEIQEAAKVITESIDQNAKVIFGAINDDKLRKNEIKVTVIASGFPQDVANESPHLPREEQSFEKTVEDSGVGKIYNSLGLGKTKREEEEKEKGEKEENGKAPQPTKEEKREKPAKKSPPKRKEKEEEKKNDDDEDDDDDDWGSIPSFLRRSKIR
ncbi:MAG: cell division protein FtsZ [Candidatus Campbellbacteria bacterium]|nr:cell division protein FtsZ [Candidatus Campbellbacteria bacterium]